MISKKHRKAPFILFVWGREKVKIMKLEREETRRKVCAKVCKCVQTCVHRFAAGTERMTAVDVCEGCHLDGWSLDMPT